MQLARHDKLRPRRKNFYFSLGSADRLLMRGSAGFPAEAHPRLKSRLLVVGGSFPGAHLHKAKQLRANLQLVSLVGHD